MLQSKTSVIYVLRQRRQLQHLDVAAAAAAAYVVS